MRHAYLLPSVTSAHSGVINHPMFTEYQRRKRTIKHVPFRAEEGEIEIRSLRSHGIGDLIPVLTRNPSVQIAETKRPGNDMKLELKKQGDKLSRFHICSVTLIPVSLLVIKGGNAIVTIKASWICLWIGCLLSWRGMLGSIE